MTEAAEHAAPIKMALLSAWFVLHPRLWRTAFRQARRLAPNAWWRRRPFLPVPAREWLGFRLQTMYGGDGPWVIDRSDFLNFMEWCRAYDRFVGLDHSLDAVLEAEGLVEATDA